MAVPLMDPPKPPANIFNKLQRATIYQIDEDLKRVDEIPPVECMFNPADYTITKSNDYEEKSNTEGHVATSHFVSVGSQSLSLSLTFDSYEQGTDVSKLTRGLWKFMETKKVAKIKGGDKNVPYQVAFEWGSFRFVAFITRITQKFTLFTHEGIPVRAKVDVDFVQYLDIEDYPPTNPTSGGGPAEKIWKVTAGDRLDTIAAEVYRDAAQWRRIAEHNKLTNPLALRPGQVLRIPIV